MMEHTHPPKLDVILAAHAPQPIEGHDLLLNYKRLLQETQGLGGENALHWLARTESRPDPAGLPAIWLHLTIETTLPQVCQRCLGTVEVPVQIEREFRFVESEAIAEQQDDESEVDLLAISREFDLAALIEDEVLLDLPLVPRHLTCPQQVKLTSVDADFDAGGEKPSPFAVLAQLKSRD